MAVEKEKLKANEVVAPTLFVGIGGTGGKIVKKVADLCAPAEKENINFVCLDTNVNDLSGVAAGKSKIRYVQTSNTQTVGSYLDYDEDTHRLVPRRNTKRTFDVRNGTTVRYSGTMMLNGKNTEYSTSVKLNFNKKK